MVGLAQLVRALVCGAGGHGFEPRIPPHNGLFKKTSLVFDVLEGLCAFVAQLDRVTDFGSVGYRFEPYRAHHRITRVLSSVG